MSRRLFSSGWPLPSDSDGFIMINKFHFHREKRDHVSSNWKQGGFFSNANFWTPPCVTLQFRHKVIREDVDSSTTLTTAMPGTSATLRPQRWLRKEERQVPWTPMEWWENVLWLPYYAWSVHIVTSTPPGLGQGGPQCIRSWHSVSPQPRWNLKCVYIIPFTLSPS